MLGDADDFDFLASSLLEASRTKESLLMAARLVSADPLLRGERRSHFSSVFKKAVEPLRASLRLFQQYEHEAESSLPELSDALGRFRGLELRELENLCELLFSLIDDQLLPNAVERESRVFFGKLRGDFARYLCEFTSDDRFEKARADAEKAYEAAIGTALQDLPPAHPTRLGTVLNYAVFKCEHCKQYDEATEMLEQAIAQVDQAVEQLSENRQKESAGIVAVMRQNLAMWGRASDGTEEEDEEEAE
jgi:14-3-3 protein epsilon